MNIKDVLNFTENECFLNKDIIHDYYLKHFLVQNNHVNNENFDVEFKKFMKLLLCIIEVDNNGYIVDYTICHSKVEPEIIVAYLYKFSFRTGYYENEKIFIPIDIFNDNDLKNLQRLLLLNNYGKKPFKNTVFTVYKKQRNENETILYSIIICFIFIIEELKRNLYYLYYNIFKILKTLKNYKNLYLNYRKNNNIIRSLKLVYYCFLHNKFNFPTF